MTKVQLGHTAMTRALLQGEVRVPGRELEFAPDLEFTRVVREMAFDFSELSLGTFLVARGAGKPLKLVPAVLTAAFQHPNLYYNAQRGKLKPEDLSGRRIGVRHYTMTPALWLRSILAEDHGVDLESLKWLTFADPHVTEFRNPANVEKVSGKDMSAMLLAGELDAMISEPRPDDARLQTLIPDPESAAKSWQARHGGAIQPIHIAVAKRSCRSAGEIYAALAESRQRAPAAEVLPFGVEAIRGSLELAIDYSYRQGMITRRYTLEELLE